MKGLEKVKSTVDCDILEVNQPHLTGKTSANSQTTTAPPIDSAYRSGPWRRFFFFGVARREKPMDPTGSDSAKIRQRGFPVFPSL